MTSNAPEPTGAESVVAGVARLEAQHAVDQGTIADLQATGVVDHAVIAHLELEGIIDRAKIANLEMALVSARRIGGAIGIIMAIEKVTEEQAYTVLRDASQKSNRKLRDVADAVLTTGTPSGVSPKSRGGA